MAKYYGLHPDVEFHLERNDLPSGETGSDTFKSFEEAAGATATLSARIGSPVTLDVVIWSEEGARAWAGEVGVEQYLEDPEASVFERLEVEVRSLGRIP